MKMAGHRLFHSADRLRSSPDTIDSGLGAFCEWFHSKKEFQFSAADLQCFGSHLTLTII